MTLFDFEELTKYWTEHPPLHILVAAYLGAVKQQGRAKRPGLEDTGSGASSEAEEVVTELGPGFRAGDVHVGLTPVVLDFAELRRQAANH